MTKTMINIVLTHYFFLTIKYKRTKYEGSLLSYTLKAWSLEYKARSFVSQ